MESFWDGNIQYLPNSLVEQITQSSHQNTDIQIEYSKSNHPILKIDNYYLHSKQDPIREVKRLVDELPFDQSERVYLFLGAGLGYIIHCALEKDELISGVWLEYSPAVLKKALETIDFSDLLKSNRLKILLSPIQEEDLYNAFRGKSTVPVTFVPHRGSLQWQEKNYNRLRLIAEGFFHKKDVNLATLVRFEKIWTKNMIHNLTETLRFHPVSSLFDIARDIPILVVGAGPSLSDSLEDIKKYQNRFLILAVDTAVHILTRAGIEPDLIYTVDPQALNSAYLEGYEGEAGLILDPTSTYLTPRMEKLTGQLKGFFTTSPFPLTEILQKICSQPIGSIPFGGSVSTNAYSLAKLMGGKPIYLVGQDLGFTYGHAHAKGAILEERLNWKESRRFRREIHNHRQLTALPKHFEQSIGNHPRKLQTNEKLIIFRNWFQENAKDAINLSKFGLKIHNLKESDLATEFNSEDSEESINFIESAESVHSESNVATCRNKIKNILKENANWSTKELLRIEIEKIQKEILDYLAPVKEGLRLSEEIYSLILNGNDDPRLLQSKIQKMNEVDEYVSSRKNLGNILSTSMQRVIFSVTEGFESELSLEEKENPRIGIAKKSVLLYQGLYDQSMSLKKQLSLALLRIQYLDNQSLSH
ncbi:MAG: motility associated factor glycosyltransferase family protein [Leptospira sp.]|nr:motility associated factor glycosyltransferase family protein [Leptospira sp.]